MTRPNIVFILADDMGYRDFGCFQRRTVANTDARCRCRFAGAKLPVYEGSIRVPMIVRRQAALSGERQRDDLVHFTDWVLTPLAAVDVEAPRACRWTASTRSAVARRAQRCT